MTTNNIKLSPQDFCGIFHPLTDYVAKKIEQYGFEHRLLTPQEAESLYIELTKVVCETTLPQSGPARHPIWEKGWGENLKAFDLSKSGLDLARPRYFNKHPVVRWDGKFWEAMSSDYEYNMLAAIQDYVFDKYFRGLDSVSEFGCGTGHNLFRVADVNPTAELHGFDWAQSAVDFINLMAKHGKIKATAHRFDYFKPDTHAKLAPNSGIYTVASLEQLGGDFKSWLYWLIMRNDLPKVVAHIEPIAEMLTPDTRLMDYLSVKYFERRNYLRGYLTFLRGLEKAGAIKILETTRTHIGSKFIEGYSVIVWAPVVNA